MTDDDDLAFWQQVLEREQQEQEAADALRSHERGTQATAAPAKEKDHGIQES